MKRCLFFLSLFLFYACGDDLADLAKDPNNPTEVLPLSLLPIVQKDAFQMLTGARGDYKIPVAARHLTFAEDNIDVQRFSWGRGDFSEFDALRQVRRMMLEARRTGETTYLALGQFFRAYHFFNLIRIYGDVPYSEALEGEKYLDPAVGGKAFRPPYDASKKIILGVLDELEAADKTLSESAGSISGDMIYQGDKLRWRKLINSFRLRLLLFLSNKLGDPDLKPSERFQKIYPALPVFEKLDESAWFKHVDQNQLRYGLYRNNSLETGTRMNQDFVDLLKRFKDPRLFKFAQMSPNAQKSGLSPTDFNAYKGADATLQPSDIQAQVSAGEISKIQPRYYSDPVNEPYILMGYAELQFILAEAAQRGWISGEAKTFYEKGIRASFAFYGFSDADYQVYIQQPEVRYNPAKGLERINLQKYIQFFCQSGWEPFFNYHRTGFPKFIGRTGPGQLNPQAPYRWAYPTLEYRYNGENLQKALQNQGFGQDAITEKLWIYVKH